MSSPTDVNFKRAMFMLENMTVSELVRFWIAFGPSRLGPGIERCNPWWDGLVI